MDWMLCYLNQYDYVTYTTSDMQSTMYLPYKEFKKYLESLCIIDIQGFIENLNKYQTLLYKTVTLSWEIYKQDTDKNVSFEDLAKINKTKEQKEKEKNEKKSIVEKSKEWIINFSRNKDNKESNKKKEIVKIL